MTFTLNSKEFRLVQGKRATEGKWSDYRDLSIYIAPNHETFLRLKSEENKFDLPISRVGISRKEIYNVIQNLIQKK
jgi:hypothetical protein